jgi:hypothetical protein
MDANKFNVGITVTIKDGRRKVIFLFQGLIPFLKEKYRDKLYEFYSNQ